MAQVAALVAVSDVARYNADGTIAEQWQEYGLDDTHHRWKKFEYDDAGRLIHVYDALGTLATYRYDRLDNVTAQGDGRGGETQFGRDFLGQVVRSRTVSDAGSPENGHDDVLAAGTVETRYLYDLHGNVVYVSDQFGDVRLMVYDDVGRPIATLEPDHAYVDENDPNHRGTKRSLTYYSNLGEVSQTVGPLGKTTRYGDFDALGRAHTVTQVVDGGAGDRVIRYEFDANGNRTRVTDGVGNVTQYAFDKLNRVRQEQINLDNPKAAGGFTPAETRTYDRDRAGNLVSYTDRNGLVTTYLYDALGRRTDEYGDSPAGGYYHAQYAFTQAGDLHTARDNASTYVFSYHDERGRVGHVDQQLIVGGQTLAMQLDITYFDALAAGDREQPTARYGYVIYLTEGNDWHYGNRYQFDALGREVFAEQLTPNGHDKRVTHEFARDPSLRPGDFNVTPYADRADVIRREQFIAGRWTEAARTIVNYEAQDAGLIRAQDHALSNGQTLVYRHNYDEAGQLRKSYERGVARELEYDRLLRLKRNGSYDANNNPQDPENDNIGAYNRLLELHGVKLDYDTEGNVENIEFSATTQVHHHWDSRNRLTSSEVNDEGYDSWSVVYVYDVFDRLIGKQRTEEGAEQPTYERIYVYDGNNVALDFLYVGDTRRLEARNFNGSGVDVLYAVDTRADSAAPLQTYWTLTDRQGNVGDVYTVEGEAPSRFAYRYGDYGQLLLLPGGRRDPNGFDETVVRFQGRPFDRELAAYNFRARWLMTFFERFLNEDPAGDVDGPNRYTAFLNSPYNYSDPTGHFVIAFGIGFVIGLGLGIAAGSDPSTAQYLQDSGEQIVLGEYTDKVTVAGTAGQMGLGFTGLDFMADIRDVSHNIRHWEWSWGHAGKTTLNAASLLPIVGAFKYLDKVATLIRSGERTAKTAKVTARSADVAATVGKVDTGATAGRTVGKGSLNAPSNVLASSRSAATGIAHLDDLAVNSSKFATFKSALSKRGWEIVDAPSQIGSDFAQTVLNKADKRILIDSSRTRWVDVLHEWRHALQTERASVESILAVPTRYQTHLKKGLEAGALNYEYRLADILHRRAGSVVPAAYRTDTLYRAMELQSQFDSKLLRSNGLQEWSGYYPFK